MRLALPTAIALVVLCAAPTASAHKYHASLAEVDYNAKEHSVEVGIRLFADDLETALGERRERRVRLDVTPNVDRLVLDYLREAVVITDPSGKRLVFEWIGMELRVDEVWVFVRAGDASGLAGAKVESHLFFELFSDQVNTVNLQQGEARTTLVFKPGDAERVVAF